MTHPAPRLSARPASALLALGVSLDLSLSQSACGLGDSGSIASWKVTVTSIDCTDNIGVASAAVAASETDGTVQVMVTRTGGKEGSASMSLMSG